jgi:hypothetical protein
MTDSPDTDALADRIFALMNHAYDRARRGDWRGAELFLREAAGAATQLSRKPMPPTEFVAVNSPKDISNLIDRLTNSQALCRERSNESGMSGECLRCGAEADQPCPMP